MVPLRLVALGAALLPLLALSAPAVPKCREFGPPNTHPVNAKAPVLHMKNKNGMWYKADGVSPAINVVHLYGTAYEMGKAQGEMFKAVMPTIYDEFFDWIDGQINKELHKFPKWLQEIIDKYGVPAALDLTYEAVKPYTPQRFIDEMHGLADGAGMNRSRIIQLQMFPELVKASCSMMGAWESATPNGKLIQLRALDWGTDSPLQKYPGVMVYHPSSPSPGGHPFSTVSFIGFLGALTGYSSAPVGICEKYWYNYKGKASREGYPWMFLLRDILQFDMDIEAAEKRIADATRTCSIFVGLGGAVPNKPTNEFRVVEYSHTTHTVYNSTSYPIYPDHPRFKDVVYVDKHTQPSHHPCMAHQIQQFAPEGKITAEVAFRNISAVMETGDLHAAVYDFGTNMVYAAYASPYHSSGTPKAVPAYARPWSSFNMTQLFLQSLLPME